MDPIREPPCRAPLVWVLVPLVTGITLARPLPATAMGALLLMALAGVGAAFMLALAREGRFPGWLWSGTFVVSAFMLSFTYASHRLPPDVRDWDSLPPREVDLDLRVERAWGEDAYGRLRGIGRIEGAPYIVDELEGHGVVFAAKLEEKALQGTSEGARFRLRGVISRMTPDPEAGTFEEYLSRHEVFFDLRHARLLQVIQEAPVWKQWLTASRSWISDGLLNGSEAFTDYRAILPAMLLGEKSLLSQGQKELFRITGMMHLFAVSGLHVGLIALTLNHMLLLLRIPPAPRALAGLLLLTLYILVIGYPPSAVRAYIMTLFFWGSLPLLRQNTSVASLAGSAVVVLLWQPRQLFDPGFQLSYGIVAGIVLYGLPLAAQVRERLTLYPGLPERNFTVRHHTFQQLVRSGSDFFCVAMGAFLMSVPLSVQFFGIFAPGAILLNLLMSPLALLCVVAGTVSTVLKLGTLLPKMEWLQACADFTNGAGWTAGLVMESVIDYFGDSPELFLQMDVPKQWQGNVLVLAIFALMILLRTRAVRARPLWLAAAPLALLLAVGLLGF